MIHKIIKGSYFKGALRYVLDPNKGLLIGGTFGSHQSPAQIAHEMHEVAGDRLRKPVFHAVRLSRSRNSPAQSQDQSEFVPLHLAEQPQEPGLPSGPGRSRGRVTSRPLRLRGGPNRRLRDDQLAFHRSSCRPGRWISHQVGNPSVRAFLLHEEANTSLAVDGFIRDGVPHVQISVFRDGQHYTLFEGPMDRLDL